MKTLKNTTGTQMVTFSKLESGRIWAMHIQIYNGEEQVLWDKDFATYAKAEKWALKQLIF